MTAEGFNKRREYSQQLVAWQTVYILNLFAEKGKQITIEDLLPEKNPERKEPQTVEEQIRIMELWVAALGGTDIRG